MTDEQFELYLMPALQTLNNLEDASAAEVISRWIYQHDYDVLLIDERVDELLAAEEGGGN